MEGVELALRCYVEPRDAKERHSWTSERDSPDFSRVLILDTETTTDCYQNLTFGSCRVYERGELLLECLFYGEVIKEKELEILKGYAISHEMELIPVRQFVDSILLPEIYEAQTPCIGFNLPFDLSRLAISWGNARGRNEGGFSFKLSENLIYPRLVIKSLDSKRSFIQFTNSFSRARGNARNRKGSNSFRGHFLDLRTLAFALTNESHSLESACEIFKADIQKTHPDEHGKITPEYIDYNRNDVLATYSLFKSMLVEYERYHLDKSPTKIYSPASIGKAYFRMMGIQPFLEKNPEFPKEILGQVMATYYGGRSEVRIRKTPVNVNLIDFLSMYPTMCIIQDLWRFVISEKMTGFEDTGHVMEFIEHADIEAFSELESWKQLNVICLVAPSEDILPARSKYGNKNTYNIGLNYVTSEIPIWYSLADIIASKLLTGKSPKVLKAIRFEPQGIQEGLTKITMIGEREIDPSIDDFFMFLMEYRDEIKNERDRCQPADDHYHQLNSLQNNIKIITNSTSYGIFVEINTTKCEGAEVVVYGNSGEPFIGQKDSIEEFGEAFNPIVSILITSAARLVLAITEAILARRGEMYAFCDTDSMAVPPSCVEEVQEYFQKLSPYSFEAKLFKMEKENFRKGSKELEPLWFYGISAKRYALYNLNSGKPIIRKMSLHGLGHILDPFSKDHRDEWQQIIWQDILDLEYGPISIAELSEKYSSLYAVSKMAICSTDVLNRFKGLNKSEEYSGQIKPFNFALVGIGVEGRDGSSVKPLAPYCNRPQTVVYQPFINYDDGSIKNGVEYWKRMDSIFTDYLNHKESKFAGEIGMLQRRCMAVNQIAYIGKEANNLEKTEVFGVRDGDYQRYISSQDLQKKDLELRSFILRLGQNEAKKYGVSKQTLSDLKRRLRNGGKLTLTTKVKSRFLNPLDKISCTIENCK